MNCFNQELNASKATTEWKASKWCTAMFPIVRWISKRDNTYNIALEDHWRTVKQLKVIIDIPNVCFINIALDRRAPKREGQLVIYIAKIRSTQSRRFHREEIFPVNTDKQNPLLQSSFILRKMMHIFPAYQFHYGSLSYLLLEAH